MTHLDNSRKIQLFIAILYYKIHMNSPERWLVSYAEYPAERTLYHTFIDIISYILLTLYHTLIDFFRSRPSFSFTRSTIFIEPRGPGEYCTFRVAETLY